MKIKMTNRHTLSATAILFYFLPILLFAGYCIKLMPAEKSWGILSLGLLLITACSLVLILILFYWEQSILEQNLHSPPLLLENSSLFTEEKTAKVTSLVSEMTYSNGEGQNEESVNSTKDSPKETNLLHTALIESQEEVEQLQLSLENKQDEMAALQSEKEKLSFQLEQAAQDFADYKLFSDEQLKQKQLLLNNLQQIIEDQRTEMEKRQEQIHQLDTKIHDLSYEIKTLLYLHEESPSYFKDPSFETKKVSVSPARHSNKQESVVDMHEKGILITEIFSSESQIRTSKEASLLLKKCMQIAEKLAGASYGNESTRYRDFSSSYYAIDQRRLFDSLRNETAAVIAVCSPKDQKILFVNNQVKPLLGWSPETFISDFQMIMEEGLQEWNKALSSLANNSDSQTRLLAKSKEGKELLLNCHFGSVPTGLFRNYIIVILYPT